MLMLLELAMCDTACLLLAGACAPCFRLKPLCVQQVSSSNFLIAVVKQVVPEPVARWQDLDGSGGESYNILDAFYAQPERFAYTFQNFVFLTRVQQVRCCVHMGRL